MKVECYSGHRGGQSPRRIVLGDRELEVDCDDRRRYVLRHLETKDEGRLAA